MYGIRVCNLSGKRKLIFHSIVHLELLSLISAYLDTFFMSQFFTSLGDLKKPWMFKNEIFCACTVSLVLCGLLRVEACWFNRNIKCNTLKHLNNSHQFCIKEFCTCKFGDFEISKSIWGWTLRGTGIRVCYTVLCVSMVSFTQALRVH